MAHIDYYFTPLSPFAYLAGDGLEKIAAKYSASIAYKPVNAGRLMNETGGLPVPQRHPSRQAYRLQDLPRIARHAGLAINLQPAHWPTDQSRAIAANYAATGGDTGALAQALARAVWAEDKDIADQAVIDAALAETGFAPASVDYDAGAAQIEPVTDEALAAGVFGFPFYVVEGERFWGQDRLPYLEDHLADLA